MTVSSVICAACVALGQSGGAPAAEEERKRPIDGVSDNSFLIEEAYNQEPRVVQHVWTTVFGADHRGEDHSRFWELSFTQEWPIFSQRHQFAWSLPYSFVDDDAEHDSDIGDASLAYRWQLLYEDEWRPAVAPTFELSLPTGDEDRGFGSGEVGYGFVLPVSKVLTDRVAVHLNLGVAVEPGVRIRFSDGSRSEERDLLAYTVAGSVIYAVSDRLHFLLEAVWESPQELQERSRGRREPRPYVHRHRGHEFTISPGLRWAWNLPNDLQIVPGLAFPIGLTEEAVDYGVFLYLSVEHPF